MNNRLRKFLLTLLLAVMTMLSACNLDLPIPLPADLASLTPAIFPVSTATTGSTLETQASPTSPPASVLAFPAADNFQWQPVASGFTRPANLVNAGDGSNRLFVVEQAGLIHVVSQGSLLPQPFLDIRSRVGSSGNEQGLLGLAFHPRFAENGFFYVNYTDQAGDTVIARFSIDPASPPESQQANPANELILLQVQQPFANHNGGHLLFGPDQMLWIALGDGGSGGDPLGNGQSLQTLLGKLLRIDVDHGSPYAIPSDNPFTSGGGLAEIWGFGLRNPWRYTFDRQTGDLFIADVGQEKWEEVDYLPAGSTGTAYNFGWNLREGSHTYQDTNPLPNNLVDPIFEYGHDQGCSITGGEVYRGRALPEFFGVYLFADFCSGTIWGLLQPAPGQWQGQVLFASGLKITSFGLDESGEIYLLEMGGGLYRLDRQ